MKQKIEYKHIEKINLYIAYIGNKSIAQISKDKESNIYSVFLDFTCPLISCKVKNLNLAKHIVKFFVNFKDTRDVIKFLKDLRKKEK